MIGTALAFILLGVAGVSLVRLVYGPGPVDRMLVAQLMGSVGVAVALALGDGGPSPSRGALTVALVLALLAAVSGVTFARRYMADGKGRRTHD